MKVPEGAITTKSCKEWQDKAESEVFYIFLGAQDLNESGSMQTTYFARLQVGSDEVQFFADGFLECTYNAKTKEWKDLEPHVPNIHKLFEAIAEKGLFPLAKAVKDKSIGLFREDNE